MSTEQQKSISFVIPTYNGSLTLEKLVKEIIDVFKKYKIEIVIINDSSPDDTHELCKNLQNNFPNIITYIKLSKNFGEHNAVMAGLRNVDGDLTIIMDDDYQNEPEEALKLVEYSLNNKFDVVFTHYEKKEDSFIRNIMSKFANFTAKVVLKKPKGIYFSSFKSIKKDLLKEIIKYEGPFPYIDGLILSETQNIGSLTVSHAKRKIGKSSYNLRKLAKHYLNLATNFSTIPIHFFSIIGAIIILISFIMIIFVIIEKITNPNIPQGFSQLITVILFFSGVQILFLGVIGEYVGKILKNVNKEKQYNISYLKKKIK